MSAFKRSSHQFEMHLPRPAPAPPRDAKSAAKLAFAAYEQALRAGDTATAEAARRRFLEASDRLRRSKP